MRRRFIEVLIPLALILALVVVVRVYPVALLRGCGRVLYSIGMKEQALRIYSKAITLEEEMKVKRYFPGEEVVWVTLPTSHFDQAVSEFDRLMPMGFEIMPGQGPGGWSACEACVPVRFRNAFTVEALEASRAKRERGEGP